MRKLLWKLFVKFLEIITFSFDRPPLRREPEQEKFKADIRRIQKDIDRRLAFCRKNKIDSISFKIIHHAIKKQKKLLDHMTEEFQLNQDVVRTYLHYSIQLQEFIDGVRRGKVFHHT